MSLLTSVEITCINTEALDRLAAANKTSAREVCAALVIERTARTERPVASIERASDYVVLTLTQLDDRARQVSPFVAEVLNKIVVEARGLGVSSIVFPTGVRIGDGNRDVVMVPAFVREAHTVSPLVVAPPTATAPLDPDFLWRAVGVATAWMRPHLDGVELTLAKAAKALRIGPILDALEGDDPRHDAFRDCALGLFSILAIRTQKRIGGGDTNQVSVLILALQQLLVERFEPECTLLVKSRFFAAMENSKKYGRAQNESTAASSAYYGMLDKLCPSRASQFSCPDDACIESFVAAALQYAMEKARHARERADLGLPTASTF